MIDAVRAWLAAEVPGIPPLAGGIVAGMYRTAPKVTLTLFDQEGTPAAVVKVARGRAAEASLRAEHAALRRFGPEGPYGSFAPGALALGRVGGRLALAQRAVLGRPMTVSYYAPGHVSSRRRVEADFARAGGWLDAFVRATARPAVRFGPAQIAEHVMGPLQRYRHEIGWGPDEQALFGRALETAEALRGEPLALGGVHGDFWMGNMLLTRTRVGLVDWELARENAPLFRDIYKFPTSYAFYLDKGRGARGRIFEHRGYLEGARIAAPFTTWTNAAGFAYAFLTDGWFPDLLRRWIDARLRAIGIDPSFNAVFFPVFLAEQATTLEDPTIRDGYRALVRLLGSGRRSSWLLQSGRSDRPQSSSHPVSVPEVPGARSM